MRAVVIAGLATLALACDRLDPVEPLIKAVAAPQFSSSSMQIYVPPTNTGGGAVGQQSVGQLSPAKWARIRVSGKVSLSTNPEALSCDSTFVPSANGSSAGPLGLPGSGIALKVAVWRGSTPLTLYLDGDSGAAKTLVIYNPSTTAENITAGRSGIDASKCNVGAYAMTGGQTVLLEDLPDPTVNALQTLVTVGDSVSFAASNLPEGLDIHWMAFYAGDTLATPKGYNGYTTIAACYNKLTCRVPVGASGRMYLRLGNTTGGNVFYPSPVVWVGKNPSTTLTLTCTPSSVDSGQSTSCVAGTNPTGQPIQVRQWFAVSKSTGSAIDICVGAATTCTTVVTEAITIYARALVGGYEQTKSATITIRPPKLQLTKNPGEAIVVTGTTISFTAFATGATSVYPTKWLFLRADGRGSSSACSEGVNPCTRSLTTAGYMYVEGLVNGITPIQNAISSITFIGTRCYRSSSECPGLGAAIDSLKAPTQPQKCQDMGAILESVLTGGGIWKVPEPVLFEGLNADMPGGMGIGINERYFGSNSAELKGNLAHEAAHKDYEHRKYAPTAQTSVEDIETLCK
jgi:hypothetical protein